MRLAKHLAHAGVASRRAAEAMIAAGRVTVDGATVTDPARDVTGEEAVAVDGRALGAAPRRVVYAVHKPAGVVSTAHDTHGRPTVVDLVPEAGTRLYPVGRLDADTTGALLLTNDGELAHRLAHPRYEVEKVYEAEVEGEPSDEALAVLEGGVELEEGLTAPARARRIGPSRIELSIHEGRKHQVKRMLEAVGHPVTRLHRSRYAGLTVEGVEPGRWRELTDEEVASLRELTRRT
jgi:23S rRNA pseudouridine2605 synthase